MRTRLVIAACAAVGMATVARGIKVKADERPGWEIKLALPGEPYRPLGSSFPTRVDCEVAIEKEARAAPSGSLILCAREERRK